jgi:hypothetical protein
MNREQANDLLTEIAAVDHRSHSAADALIWHGHLADIDFDDARQAVYEHRRNSTDWLEIAHVVAGVRRLRAARHEAANLIYEPAPDETVTDFISRARGANRSAASGNVIPIRPGIALPPGQAAPAPPSIANVVKQVREARGAKHPALAVACPWGACNAQPGSWCERPTAGSRGAKSVPGFVHPARCDAAGAQFVPQVPELSAQERSEREFSRALASKRAAEDGQ